MMYFGKGEEKGDFRTPVLKYPFDSRLTSLGLEQEGGKRSPS